MNSRCPARTLGKSVFPELNTIILELFGPCRHSAAKWSSNNVISNTYFRAIHKAATVA